MKKSSEQEKFEFRPLITLIGILSAMLIIGIGFVSYTYNTLINEAISYIGEICELGASNISKKLDTNIYALESYAPYLSTVQSSDAKHIIDLLEDELALNGHSMMRVSYANREGKGYTVRNDGVVNYIDIHDKDYFKNTLEGNITVSPTVIDYVTRQPVNIYALPVFNNNVIVGTHMGVCLSSSLETAILDSYFGGNGIAYIVDNNMNRVIDSQYSDEENYNPYKDLNISEETLQKIIELINEKPDKGTLLIKTEDNKGYYLTYSPINTANWYLLLAVPRTYVMKNAVQVVFISLVVLAVALISVVAFMQYLESIKRSNRERLYKQIYFDDLTELYSKNGFALKAGQMITEDKSSYAIIFCDIDNFRTINELFGYDTGTAILRNIGSIIAKNLNEGEIASRVSGDDFVMLVKYTDDQQIINRVNGLIEQLSNYDFDENHTNYNIVTYYGIYKLEDNPSADNWESYIDKAKLSLTGIQQKRISAYAFYNEGLQQQMHFEAELENDAQQALKDGDFLVYIQPKFDAKTLKLAGGEALVRWQHKTKGFLTPNKFITLLEKTGLITEVDMYVYDQVCRMQKKLLDEGYTPLPISVNQSRLHLYQSNYIDNLKVILNKYDLPAEYVELEITESIALSSGDVLEKAVKHIHQIGFTVSMDDFGSGESSLNILKDIDIDVLKLDRMFFLETENNLKARQIIKSIIDMANQLNISTVAEGVENESQLKFLQEAGCDLVQCYHFAKPMPYEDFEKLYKDHIKNENNKDNR